MLKRTFATAAFVAALALATAPGAGATEIGHAQSLSGSGGENCGTNVTWVQTAATSANYTVPFDGVVTSWSVGDHISTAIKLKVLRPASSNAFSVIASDGPRNPPNGGISTYPVRFPVRQGDSIAMHVGTFHNCFPGYGAAAADTALPVSGDPAVGQSIEVSGTSFTSTRLPISATVEADADNDGYGDETQDLCPTDPTTHGLCDVFPPETTITKGPKKKTKSKSATFEFGSSEPGSTFECSLDSSGFKPCTSPDTVRVKGAGKHNFLVRARDDHGNLDTSEASWSWKLAKKKHKKHKH
jgi:hypothetical protein